MIKNIVPYYCTSLAAYEERRVQVPSLKGEALLEFTVEFQGELTNLYVRNVSIEDSIFIARLRDAARYLEFDPWGTLEDETDVKLRLNFGS
ncbi:MAG: hypothetical protein GF344_09785 [Chitinivibrionales bacterium]|nr:hypothetical protein [Chitinivibrionales bacterium]MBD3357130.1 hypothetical protein [Chitinivibrionales bacterium]